MARIALVVLDTLRKDTFDEHFGWLSGRRFEHAWSTSHWTVPAHATLFTGKYGSEAGVFARSQTLDCDDSVLAERLQKRGYRTRGFSSNLNITPRFNYDRGFESFELHGSAADTYRNTVPFQELIESTRLPGLGTLLAGLRVFSPNYDTGASIRRGIRSLQREYPSISLRGNTDADAALEYIQNLDFSKDEFLFLNLMDVHSPYLPPSSYQSHSYTNEDITAWSNSTFLEDEGIDEVGKSAYSDAARFLSDKYREIVAELDSFDYIFTLSDHGEMFGENGIYGHSYGVHPNLTHIPLVVSGPSVNKGVEENPVNLQDVHRTILEISGGGGPKNGINLLEEVPQRNHFTEYHGISHERRLKRLQELGLNKSQIDTFDKPRYGVQSGKSYGYETINGFVVDGPDDSERLFEILQNRISTLPTIERNNGVLQEEVKDQLSDLGYI